MIEEKARAKLNFVLNVGQKRGKKHELDTVIVPIELFDTVTLSARDDGKAVVRYDGIADRYPNDPAKRLAEKVIEKYALPGVEIAVTKRIPEGAGLGGSSTDAAAVARGMEKLFGFGKVEKTFLTEAGSDVYAAYLDVPCRVRGTGDIVDVLDGVVCPNVVILCPDFSLPTAACYEAFDKVGGEEGDVEKIVAAMKKGEDFLPKNGLLRAALALQPKMADAVRAVKDSGLYYGMTGSGSAVYAFGYNKEYFLERLPFVGEYGRKTVLIRE